VTPRTYGRLGLLAGLGTLGSVRVLNVRDRALPLLLMTLVMGLAGCGSSGSSSSAGASSAASGTSSALTFTNSTTNTNVTTVTNPPTDTSSSASPGVISQGTFKGTWPFTVDHGTLSCEPPQSVAFTDPSGTTYGVNGSAQDAGHPNVTPIWKKDNSGNGGPRVYLGDVIDAGLKLCG